VTAPFFASVDFWLLLPEILLGAAIVVVLVADLLVPPERAEVLAGITLAGIAAVIWSVLATLTEPTTASRGLMAVDAFGAFFKVLVLLSAGLTVLFSRRYLQVVGVSPGVYYFLILCATLGMMVMAAAIDLLTLFVGLEIMTVSFYVLAGFLKLDRRSNEAAVKYFVLGAFSLGILLYGMSLLYALTGTTKLRELAMALPAGSPSLALTMGVLLIGAGMAFKIAAVPFHMWAPDVYEGAPTPVAAFLSVGSKAASFAMLIRILFEALPSAAVQWSQALAVLAVLSMTVGNIAALTQSNVKRMLAYSSIAHAGYVLIGVVVATPRGVAATLVYLLVYVFMQMGAFGILAVLQRRGESSDEMHELSGLFFRAPLLAVCMLLCLLSLGGIPPTAGFMGKFWIFSAAIEADYGWLAVIGVLNSAVSLYYYIRVVVFMWMKEQPTAEPIITSRAAVLAMAVVFLVTLGAGIYPAPLFDAAQRSAATLGAAASALTAR